ncbi:MAG TPA: ABC transporter permease [Streptosporangiaceae bacterium]|nr:ABC transporter permease [Streptosporangiaceae bacterium]
MIWLTWRQFRTQAATVFAALAALAVVLAVTGPSLAHDYAAGIAACTTHGGCSAFTNDFFNSHQSLYFGLVAVVMFVPAIIGLFWGAPLITRELEAGTHRLVWNQSVTRTRWLAFKLGFIGLAAMAAAGLASLAVTWWSSPIDTAAADRFPRLSPLLFDARGIAPLGYAAFAFTLGVTVGILIRRALPAMAITLTVFAVVQIAMPLAIRPHLIPPVRLTTTITATNVNGFLISPGRPVHVTVGVSEPGAWIISNQTINAAGHVVSGVPVSLSTGPCVPAAPPRPPFSQACFTKISQLGYQQQVAYQPAGRFWAFQWYETAIFLVLALALAGSCFWWTRRRLS